MDYSFDFSTLTFKNLKTLSHAHINMQQPDFVCEQ